MSDIFLSYAREDIAVAQLLATALEARGWSVFWDRRIPAGRRFAEVIADELDAAKCVIVLWSGAATASDWVLDEAEEARQRNVLAPALIEPIQPPMGFRRIHAADLIGWQGQPAHTGYRRLLEDVAQYVAPAQPAAPEAPPGPHQSSVATETAPAAASETGSNSHPSSAPGATVAKDHQLGRGRVSVRKWAGALAAVIVLAVLSNWLINSMRRFDTQQRADQQDPAAGAGAPGGAAEPAAGQNSGVPKVPSDRSASRESRPPPATPATSPAPVRSERNPPKTLHEAALAALPDAALRRRDAPWRRAASADLLTRMDSIEESIAAAFAALDRTPPDDRYELHARHSAELRVVLEPPSTPIDEAALPGNWLCRSSSLSNHGALTYAYFDCAISRTAQCLQLRKTTGSSRFEGCLYRLDDRTYIHVATMIGVSGQRYEGRAGGFLTQTRPDRLRLLAAEGPISFGVLDFKRR